MANELDIESVRMNSSDMPGKNLRSKNYDKERKDSQDDCGNKLLRSQFKSDHLRHPSTEESVKNLALDTP